MARVRAAVRRGRLPPQLRPGLAADVPPARRARATASTRRTSCGTRRSPADGERRWRSPASAEALARLCATPALRLGLVTAGDRAVVEPQLERTGLGRLLDDPRLRRRPAVHKPDPAPLRPALRAARPGRPTGGRRPTSATPRRHADGARGRASGRSASPRSSATPTSSGPPVRDEVAAVGRGMGRRRLLAAISCRGATSRAR